MNLINALRRGLYKKSPLLLILLLILIGVFIPLISHAEEIVLFSANDMQQWDYQTFNDIKQSDYKVIRDDVLNQSVLLATSNKSASGYTLNRKINLNKTPWLHFLWRVDRMQSNPQEGTKAGDDFAVRLYFVRQKNLTWQTLNLVYTSSKAATDSWQSPFSSIFNKIQAFAIAQHHPDNIQKWQSTHVNIAELWQSLFKSDPSIELIGIMTDSDSVPLNFQARYGAIIVSSSPTSPFSIPK